MSKKKVGQKEVKHSISYTLQDFGGYKMYLPEKDTKVASPCKCPGCMPVKLSYILRKVKKIAGLTKEELLKKRPFKNLLWVIKVERWDVAVGTFQVGWQTVTTMGAFTFCITVGYDGKGQVKNLSQKKPNGKYYRFFGRDKLFFPKYNKIPLRAVAEVLATTFNKG